MKRLLVFALSFVLIVGVVAGAVYEGKPPIKEEAWDNLPDAWKFNFTTFGESGANTYSEAEFQIAGYIFTEESAKRFYKDDWPEPKDWVDSVLSKFSRPVNIYVYSYGNSTEPFDPAKFTFSQYRDSTEYSVDPETGMSGFESGDVMMGMVDVPSEINAKESFYIHYEYGSAKAYTSGYFVESPYPEEEKKSQETEETETSEESLYESHEQYYDFEEPNSGPPFGWNTTRAGVSITEGKLRVVADKDSTNSCLKPLNPFNPPLIDIRVEGEVLEGNGAFGIVFGVDKKTSSFYDFLVYPKMQEYLWSHFNGNTFVQESDWKYKPSIINEGINRLRVERTGDKYFNLYINGHQVETLELESYEEGGRCGVTVNAFDEITAAVFEYFNLKT